MHRSRATGRSAVARRRRRPLNSTIISCSSRTATSASSKHLLWRHRAAVTSLTLNRTRRTWSSTTCHSPCHRTTSDLSSPASATSSRVNSSGTSRQVHDKQPHSLVLICLNNWSGEIAVYLSFCEHLCHVFTIKHYNIPLSAFHLICIVECLLTLIVTRPSQFNSP